MRQCEHNDGLSSSNIFGSMKEKKCENEFLVYLPSHEYALASSFEVMLGTSSGIPAAEHVVT